MKKQDPTRPDPQEAAEPLFILRYVVVYAMTAPPRNILDILLKRRSDDGRQELIANAESDRERYWRPLVDAGLWAKVSQRERELAASTFVTMSAQQQIDASWRVEAVQALMWALGLIPELPPYDTKAGHDLWKMIPSADSAGFIAAARLRDSAEIDRARGLADFWHWRSRTRELIEEGRALPQPQARGFKTYDEIVRFAAQKAFAEALIPDCFDEDFPALGKAYRALTPGEWAGVRSITAERHFALNWLCGYAGGNRWDETPTDT